MATQKARPIDSSHHYSHDGAYDMSEGRRSRLIQTWFYDDQLDEIENWRRAQPGIPSRAVAVRTFVGLGLKAASMEKQQKDHAA